jgi:hypothetical protein
VMRRIGNMTGPLMAQSQVTFRSTDRPNSNLRSIKKQQGARA